MEKEKIISFDSLSIGYRSGRQRKSLLSPLSAAAFSGEFIALIGRNGIGKSTLLRTLIKLQEPLSGSLEIRGEPVKSLRNIDLARIAGFISTEPVKVINMRVSDLVSLGRYPHTSWIGEMKQEDRDAVETALQKTGMTGYSTRYVSELSDGERQRAMIARLLAQDTGLMIMDEPTAFLDIPSRLEIMKLLLSLTREGKTIIFSTHDLGIALKMADRVWLLVREKLIIGTPRELLENGSFDDLFGSRGQMPGSETRGDQGKPDETDYRKYFL